MGLPSRQESRRERQRATRPSDQAFLLRCHGHQVYFNIVYGCGLETKESPNHVVPYGQSMPKVL